MAGKTKPRALTRSMRVIATLLLTLSAVTPASSVFVIVPDVIASAGTGAFLSMAVAAFLAIPIAYVYAELASAYPIAGGEYSMLGRTVGGAAGVATCGLTILNNILSPAVLALGAGPYVAGIVPGLHPMAVGMGIIALATLFAVLHIRANIWLTGIFLALELLALAVLAALGWLDVKRSLWEIATHPAMVSDGKIVPTPAVLIGVATTVSMFAYNGYGSAVYFAEDMHEAPRLIARTILWALVITVATELGPLTAVLMGAPDLHALLTSKHPFGDFVMTTGGPTLNIVINLSVALAILNAVLASIVQNARLFYCTGRDAAWHSRINDAFLVIHHRFGSPWIATLAAGALSIAMCLLGLKTLIMVTSMGIALIYAAVCLAVIVGRITGATGKAGYRMPLYPLWPVLGLAALVYVFYTNATNAADPDTGRRSLIINIAVAIIAVAYYALILRRKKDFAFREPESQCGAR